MSFLSLAFLAALPLAAAPIVLHLFDRRRNVVIQWGAMQFLVEAASRRTSARKLKQWLLLLLRVIAIAALVLALARPLLPGSWFGTLDRGETILVVDNSMSMMRGAEGATLFDKAIDQGVEQLNEIAPGDFVRILTASPYPVWLTGASLRADAGSEDSFQALLRRVEPTQGSSDLLAALFTAIQAELQPGQQRRRIVLLTDGQASDWNLNKEDGWRRLRDALAATATPTTLDVIELEGTVPEEGNVAVNQIRTSRTVVGSDEIFTLAAEVQNYGRTAAGPTTAAWTVGDDVLHESHVPALEAGAVREVVWKHSFAETGVYGLSCRLATDDPLPLDNSATTIVQVVASVPIGLVEGAAEMAELQRDAYFVQAGLGWIDGQSLPQRSVYVPETLRPEHLGTFDLDRHQAIVIPNLTELEEDAVARLEEFVFDGGGLWIAVGPRTDIDAYNELLFAEGNGLAPLALDRIVSEEPADAGETGRAMAIDPYIGDSPALVGLQNTEQLDIADVQVSRRFRFVPPPVGDDVSVLLGLTNGEPLAVENYVGRGRVIVQAVPLQLQWSDLARSQSFVVMLHDWLNYLAQPKATRHNLAPGEPISVHLARSDAGTATLTTPQGDEIELAASGVGDGVVFRSSRTILPGNYSLEIDLAGDEIPFHVNRLAKESDLVGLTDTDRERRAQLTGLGAGAERTNWTATNQREPLWPLLLMVLIAVIAGELLLSGAIARERFGAAPVATTGQPVISGGIHGSPDVLNGPLNDGERLPAATPSTTFRQRARHHAVHRS